jgi:hypothetical protein
LDIAISVGFVEAEAPPVAGTKATEIVIRAARIVRIAPIHLDYQGIEIGSQQSLPLEPEPIQYDLIR